MFFKFFNELNKDNYSFKEFKIFCIKLSKILSINKQKKLVKKSHDAYINALKGYEKILEYGLEAVRDVDRCNEVIDSKGKEYFQKLIGKEFSQAMIGAKDLSRMKESEITLSINEKIKEVIEWKYK
jgi:hypothetical protein